MCKMCQTAKLARPLCTTCSQRARWSNSCLYHIALIHTLLSGVGFCIDIYHCRPDSVELIKMDLHLPEM